MPRVRPRHSAILPWLMRWISASPTRTEPAVGWSMPVIMLIKVDLPLPDLPMMLVNSPCSKVRLMPFRAWKSPAVVLKVLTTSRSSIRGIAHSISSCGTSVRLPSAIQMTRE